MSATAQTDRQLGRNSPLGSPWYSPPLSARSEPDPLGGYCHSSHTGRQADVNLCDLPFRLPAHWSEQSWTPVSAGDCRFVAWRSQVQTRGLELAAKHETRETPTRLCRRKLLSDFKCTILYEPRKQLSPTENTANDCLEYIWYNQVVKCHHSRLHNLRQSLLGY